MAAPEGNQFWKLRAKHGRDKLFATPELLWEAACEYFEWIDSNPLLEAVLGKGNAKPFKDEEGEYHFAPDVVEMPKMRPYTLHGICLYCDCSTSYFRAFKSTLKEKDKDFLTVITRIEEIIYNQKFEGAASGFLNPNIIARDLGLTEKQTIEQNQTLNYGTETLEILKELNETILRDSKQ